MAAWPPNAATFADGADGEDAVGSPPEPESPLEPEDHDSLDLPDAQRGVSDLSEPETIVSSRQGKSKRRKKKQMKKQTSSSSPRPEEDMSALQKSEKLRGSSEEVGRQVTPHSNFVKLQSFLAKDIENPGWVARIEKVMRSTKYNVVTGFIILADVGFNWMDIDIRASGESTPTWLEVCATICLVIYTFEMITISILRGRHVFQDQWFILDVVIVGSGLLQLFLGAIGISVDEVALLRVLTLGLRSFQCNKNHAENTR